MTNRSVAALAVILAAFGPTMLSAQARTVDEGTFVLTRNGAPVGREFFRIVRSPSASGDQFRATAQLAVGDQRVMPSLSTDSAGAPLSYEVAVRDGTTRAVHLRANARPGRFSALVQTPHGESAKEYVVPANLVVLDDQLAHQFFFVTLGGRKTGPLTVIDPRASAQLSATLETRGADAVDVGGKRVEATHYSLSAAGQPTREFWIDGSGRVLKVAVPSSGFLALRDELPR